MRLTEGDRRVRVGLVEAFQLADLVAQWQARGATDADLRTALLVGLPSQVHSAVALLRTCLERKMPPEPVPRPEPVERHECAHCRVPVAQAGICRTCAGVPEAVARGAWTEITQRGVAAARAAMSRPGGCGGGLAATRHRAIRRSAGIA